MLPVHLVLASSLAATGAPAPDDLGWAEDDQFCVRIQHFMATTKQQAQAEIYLDYEEYVSSKPKVNPLTVAQYSFESEDDVKIISCKVKAADHIREHYGDNAAGLERTCADAAQLMLDQVVAGLPDDELRRPAVVVAEKPAWIGPIWLGKLEQPLLGVAADGLQVRAPGFHVDWNDWRFAWAPKSWRGNHYCHFVAPSALRAALTQAEPEP